MNLIVVVELSDEIAAEARGPLLPKAVRSEIAAALELFGRVIHIEIEEK